MAKKKKKVEVRERYIIKDVKLDNKSRKGEYVYIKERKRKPKYYKKREGLTKKDYTYFYKKGIVTKRGGVTKRRIRREKRIDSISKKYPKIEVILGKGIAQHTIKDAKKDLSPNRIKLSYANLLKNTDRIGEGDAIVKDKELLDLITRVENTEKWKHRVAYEVLVSNEKGEILTTMNNVVIKSLGEVKREVVDVINLGQDYEGQYRRIEGIIKNSGYRMNEGTTRNGKVASIKIKMVFRKGRL